MSLPTFAAAQMTNRMVNRAAELETLQQAICRPGHDTRVVIIEGEGGLGKTRLLNEALWRAGHSAIFPGVEPASEKWSTQAPVIISDLLDFIEVRLHTFNRFLEALRQAFAWNEQVEFPTYDAAMRHYKRKLKDRADYFTIKQAAENANKAFFDDYRQITEKYRLVWALDTAEQLSYVGVPWLLEKGLLTPDDLSFSTQQQIFELLKAGELLNTTLILVGRPAARVYFEQLEAEAKRPSSKFELQTIQLNVFKAEDVKSYLSELAKDCTAQYGDDDDTTLYLKTMAEDNDRIEVLCLYTGGQPVRLALFVDILTEGKKEPEALQDTFEQAKVRIRWDYQANKPDEKALAEVQFQIEEEFINLIFSKTTDLRSRILTALVRARRGLNEERLHFVLGTLPGASVGEWEKDPELRREIEQEMEPSHPHSLRRLSFVKVRSDGRLILQDELYRIYDEHMAADETAKDDEAQARLKLYQQLQSFAQAEIGQLKQIRTQNRLEDERSLRWESPARALSMRFRILRKEEEQERIFLDEQILEAQAEKLHYELRVSPDEGFNDAYNDLAEQRWLAGNLEADAQIQIELWQFFRDKYAHQFIELEPRKSMVKNSTPWQSLERAAQQDDITRWVKRFFIRGEAKRAIEFADQIEANLEQLPEVLRVTLDHTFSRGERTCWREFARIYLGQDIPGAIARLKEAITQMERLLTAGIPERDEYAFQGHPGEIRLRRVIGVTYNNLGIGYTSQGYYRQASQAYSDALRYLHDTDFLAQEAITRNNLSRALSEMGLITRAIRICQDGLNLREKLGAENPIAFSHNTLAVIYNNGIQPENAWFEAVKAILYFRKLEDQRGLGLALLQLGEALRRLADSKRPQLDKPEELFDAALDALSQAVEIFDRSPEIIRQIEALIEQGCLYRDYMIYIKDDEQVVRTGRFRQYKNRALNALQKAVSLAKARQFFQHQLDAQVNLAWTYYYIGDTEATAQAIEGAFHMVPDNCLLKRNTPPPSYRDAESYVFLQLGKVSVVKARLHMDHFKAVGEAIIAKSENKPAGRWAVRMDPEATQVLKEAAEAFVLALGYNRLYSTRSVAISTSLNNLYDYLRGFNAIAMEDFFKYQRQARAEYRIAEIEPEDVTDLEVFLLQSFGNYFESVPHIQEAR